MPEMTFLLRETKRVLKVSGVTGPPTNFFLTLIVQTKHVLIQVNMLMACQNMMTIFSRRKTMRKRQEIITAEWTMRLAGWLDKCVDGIPDVGSLDPVKPDCVQPTRSWRAAVAAKKQEFMSERVKNLPSNPAGGRAKNTDPNVVKVVGKSYIDQMFKPSSKDDFCL